jgi:hypothetical protein
MRKLAWLISIALAVACGSGGTGAEDARSADASDASPDAADPGGTWGWISVIETNDFLDHIYVIQRGWYGGVRAYFATKPSWPRSLTHTLGFAKVVASEGSCELVDAGLLGDGCEDCFCLDKGIECAAGPEERWCEPDETCVQGPERPEAWPDRGVCVPLPPHFDVGAIALEGLKVPITMQPDEFDRYMADDLPKPVELFDDDTVVTATTSGGGMAPLTFSAKGVEHLVVDDKVVHVRLGKPSVVRWTPADPDARILVILRAGSHDPYPVSGAIVCEADDAAGEVEVPADLLEQLVHLGCDGAYMMKQSVIFRYQQDVKQLPDGAVELFIGSARSLQMAFE